MMSWFLRRHAHACFPGLSMLAPVQHTITLCATWSIEIYRQTSYKARLVHEVLYVS